jgi:type I restriction-modification system DNA methylase subunit
MVNDRAVYLLPNGVLASGIKEECELRKQLIKQNVLLAVITLPPNMFESTTIPTCLLVFDKNKKTRKTAMIDLRDHCEEEVRDQRGQFGGASHTNRVYHKTVNIIPSTIMSKCAELLTNVASYAKCFINNSLAVFHANRGTANLHTLLTASTFVGINLQRRLGFDVFKKSAGAS